MNSIANILRKEERNLNAECLNSAKRNKRINMWKEIKEDKKYLFGISNNK